MTAAGEAWALPDRGRVGIGMLIVAETALFVIFVVAYLFYAGKSASGPTPGQVLDLPVLGTICLLASSGTITMAVRALARGAVRVFAGWWLATIVLAVVFLGGTGLEWYRLIVHDGLTIRTNLFGTTFYSLVGLHGAHVVVGLVMLVGVLLFTARGHVRAPQAARTEVVALYWHFVDAVWVVVFLVVYVLTR